MASGVIGGVTGGGWACPRIRLLAGQARTSGSRKMTAPPTAVNKATKVITQAAMRLVGGRLGIAAAARRSIAEKCEGGSAG